MDFSNPAVLLSGLFIGSIGIGLFMYGKMALEPKCIGIGLAMCIYPYFISSMLLLWAVTGACLLAVYFLPRSA